MLPDIKIKEFYLRYVYNAKRDIENYTNTLESVKETINELHSNIEEYVVKLNDKYDLDLNHFETEWIKREYNKSEYLYKQILKLVKTVEEDRSILIQES